MILTGMMYLQLILQFIRNDTVRILLQISL